VRFDASFVAGVVVVLAPLTVGLYWENFKNRQAETPSRPEEGWLERWVRVVATATWRFPYFWLQRKTHTEASPNFPSTYVASTFVASVALFLLVGWWGPRFFAGVGIAYGTWRAADLTLARLSVTLFLGRTRNIGRSVLLAWINLLELVFIIGLWNIALDRDQFSGSIGAWEALRLALPIGSSVEIQPVGSWAQAVSFIGPLLLLFMTVFVLAVLASDVSTRGRRGSDDPNEGE